MRINARRLGIDQLKKALERLAQQIHALCGHERV